jgi:hypothetical protein
MLRLLQWLIFGHVHKWTIVKESRLNYSDDFGSSGSCTRYTLQCEICGNMKIYDAQ